MIRTQVSLDERDYKLAKREAKAQGISVAEFVRRALRNALPAERDKPWLKYIGMVDSGDPHSGETIDEVVYGTKP